MKWDPLALLAAAYALCMAIYMWFDLWGVRNFAAARGFLFYIALFAELFVLYLIAASSLPADGSDHDLREFYSGNRRRFWFLILLFQAGYVAAGFYLYSGEIVNFSGAVVALALTRNVRALDPVSHFVPDEIGGSYTHRSWTAVRSHAGSLRQNVHQLIAE